jgi:hypothetical protein
VGRAVMSMTWRSWAHEDLRQPPTNVLRVGLHPRGCHVGCAGEVTWSYLTIESLSCERRDPRSAPARGSHPIRVIRPEAG